MPRPTDVNDHATFESRSAGGHARAAKFRAVREEAKERAIERLAGMSEKALTRLEAILDVEDDAVAYRAVRDVARPDRHTDGRPRPRGSLRCRRRDQRCPGAART